VDADFGEEAGVGLAADGVACPWTHPIIARKRSVRKIMEKEAPREKKMQTTRRTASQSNREWHQSTVKPSKE